MINDQQWKIVKAALPSWEGSFPWRRVGSRVAVALLLAVGAWWFHEPLRAVWGLLQNQEQVSELIMGAGWWGPLVLGVLQYGQVLVAVIPGHMVVVAGGYLYGFWFGLLLNLLFVVSASQLGFLLARWVGRPFVHRMANTEQVAHWESLAERHGLVIFLVAFLLPVMPSDLMNFVAGLSGIRPRRFLAANLFGRLPGVVLLTLLGARGLTLTLQHWLLLGIGALLVAAAGRLAAVYLEAGR